MSFLAHTGGSGNIMFGDSGDNDIGIIGYEHNGDFMRFTTNGSERMRITSGSQTLIGKTTAGITNVGTEIGGAGDAIFTRTNAPCLLLNRKSGTGEQIQFYYGDNQVGNVSVDGSATAFNTSSDYRLKENEVAISDGITRIKQLKPYRFNFKIDADTTLDGFFAHEVSSIVPEAISGEKDAMHPEVLYTADDELPDGKNIGDVKEATKINAQGIDQAKLVPVTVACLKELITKVETLEAKVAVLEG